MLKLPDTSETTCHTVKSSATSHGYRASIPNIMKKGENLVVKCGFVLRPNITASKYRSHVSGFSPTSLHNALYRQKEIIVISHHVFLNDTNIVDKLIALLQSILSHFLITASPLNCSIQLFHKTICLWMVRSAQTPLHI